MVLSGSATPTLAVTGTTAVSGTNTGDQTSVTGNAGTATALQTSRNINGTSFNGTADITVTAAAGTLTGTTLNSTVVSSSLTSVGILTGLSITGTETITSSSANSLVVGRQGTTSPTLKVDSSTATCVTGITIKSAVSGGTTDIINIGPSNNEGLRITLNGATGNLLLDGPSGAGGILGFQLNGVTYGQFKNSGVQFNLTANRNDSNNPILAHFLYTNPADVLMTASTEASAVVWDLSNTRQHNTGTLALQRDFRIQPSTHSFVGASTLTMASALSVDGAPSGGTNATITSSAGLLVSTRALSNVTSGYGVYAEAPSGATKNYAMRTIGGTLSDLNSITTSQFDKTTSTDLADIAGLTATVASGITYGFRAVLDYDADVVGGQKYSLAGTATATSIRYTIKALSNATNAYVITSRQTALAGNAGQAGSAAGQTLIEGYIVVNAGGTLTVQFAQNASNGTSSILTGSQFLVWPM